MNGEKIKVLFVCLGNICRSPAAEGTFRHLVQEKGLSSEFVIDSAGTGAYHIGESPNSNMQKAAARHGITLDHKARQFQVEDFDRFDWIYPMDESNYRDVLSLARNDQDRKKVVKFRTFDPDAKLGGSVPDVPDPYSGGMDGFHHVQKIMMRTGGHLLSQLKKNDSK